MIQVSEGTVCIRYTVKSISPSIARPMRHGCQREVTTKINSDAGEARAEIEVRHWAHENGSIVFFDNFWDQIQIQKVSC